MLRLSISVLMTLCVVGKSISTSYISTPSNTHHKHIVKELCPKDDLVKAANCKISTPDIITMISRLETIRMKPPCYCHLKVCGQYSVPIAFLSCKSGFVHANKCGACVRCAKDLGELCGGVAQKLGSCRNGLLCEVKDNKDKNGICVLDLKSNSKMDKIYMRTKVSFNVEMLVKDCGRHLLTNPTLQVIDKNSKPKDRMFESTADEAVTGGPYKNSVIVYSQHLHDKGVQTQQKELPHHLRLGQLLLGYSKNHTIFSTNDAGLKVTIENTEEKHAKELNVLTDPPDILPDEAKSKTVLKQNKGYRIHDDLFGPALYDVTGNRNNSHEKNHYLVHPDTVEFAQYENDSPGYTFLTEDGFKHGEIPTTAEVIPGVRFERFGDGGDVNNAPRERNIMSRSYRKLVPVQNNQKGCLNSKNKQKGYESFLPNCTCCKTYAKY